MLPREIRRKSADFAIPDVRTDKQLSDLCLEWQWRWRLMDWNLTIAFATREEMGPEADAEVDTDIRTKRAHILIIRREDYSRTDIPYDPEQLLLHEMGHLMFDYFSPEDWNSPLGILLEQAIDLTACALVRAKRGQ